MESFLTSAADIVLSADQWLLAISAVLLSLAGIAKLTKTKKDDKYVQIAIDYLNKARNLLTSFSKKTK